MKLKQTRALMQRKLEETAFDAFGVLIGCKGEEEAFFSENANEDTLFDIASCGKVLHTVPLALQAIGEGRLLIYLNDVELYPLQLILRQILVASQISLNDMVDVEAMEAKQGLADMLKYALIVVSTAPILCMYPFIQRYLIKGAMIGSVKG